MGIENPELLSESQTEAENPNGRPVDPELDELQDLEEIASRETHDGPGDLSDLPPSDFVSYATEGVEKETD